MSEIPANIKSSMINRSVRKSSKIELLDFLLTLLNESVLHLRRITTKPNLPPRALEEIPISTVLVRIEGDTYTRAFVL